MNRILFALAVLLLAAIHSNVSLWAAPQFTEYPVPGGSGAHDVAPAPDGTVWYTGQAKGVLGRLDPVSGKVKEIPLGRGSAPHGVVVGPDGAAWVTDGGQNAIARVDAKTEAVTVYPLPTSAYANLNTPVFDPQGVLWFTGQSGIYGRLELAKQSGLPAKPEVWDAPRGSGPYGITVTPKGVVYYASLAGSYVGRITPPDPRVTVLNPPTKGQGARRVWSDSKGRVWVSEWNGGRLAMHDPASGAWKEWRLPGSDQPLPYAVYVDEQDLVWLTDWRVNAFVRFDPATEKFTRYPLPSSHASIRHIAGRPGEIWGAESAHDKLVVLRLR